MDRVGMPSDPSANLIAPSRDRKDADHKSGGPRYLLARAKGTSAGWPFPVKVPGSQSHWWLVNAKQLSRSTFSNPGQGVLRLRAICQARRLVSKRYWTCIGGSVGV